MQVALFLHRFYFLRTLLKDDIPKRIDECVSVLVLTVLLNFDVSF